MRTLWLVVALPFVSPLLGQNALAAPTEHVHHHPASLPAGRVADGSLFNLEQTWTDDEGRKRKWPSFSGRPIVMAMVYMSCQAACPLIVSDMKRIEAALPEDLRDRVQWLLMTFDSARDTTQRLKDYRAERKLDARRWTLLRAGDDEVRDLAAAIGFRFKPLPNGDFQHSNLVTIVDKAGVVQLQLNGIGEPIDGAVKLLRGP